MEYKKLDDIFLVIRNGANIKQTPNKAGKPITRIETIVDNKIDLTRVGYADILNDNYEDFYLKDGDILMSHINSVSHLGKVAIFENIDIDIIHGMNLLVLKGDKSKVFPKYSYYYFITNKFRKQLIPITKKSVNQASFNISDLKELEIPLASYENQIRIANLLEKTETTIAERKNGIDLLDELIKATFYQMFGDPVKNGKGWRKDEIGNITNVGTGATPSRNNETEYFNGRIPWIKTTEVDGGQILDSEEKITEKAIKETNCKVYPLNTILLAMYGQGKTRGNVAMLKIEAATNQACAAILPNEMFNEVFSFYQMKLLYSFIRNLARGGNQENLNLSIVKKIELIIPPIELQDQFATIAQKIERIKAEQKAQLKDLEELYASISHQVFAGDLDLSKVPFDANLLPSTIEVTQEEPLEKPVVVELKETSKEEIKKVIKPIIKGKLAWENISFKEVADYIQHEFDRHYFNTEMLLRYLKEDIGIVVNYFSSAEQKKNPQYENADDFYRFIATALTGENHFLQLEQIFYNAETENIPNISFTETDVENLSKKDKKERSGIYFHIKNETTTP